MNDINECADVCNSLLRGELSAVESYTQAIEKFDTEVEVSALSAIRSDHEQAAARLREHILDMGAEPASGSGAWGTFVKALEGSAKLVGESPALAVLEEGEEHGINEYRSALNNPQVMEEIKQVIRGELLPSLTGHLPVLSRLRNK